MVNKEDIKTILVPIIIVSLLALLFTHLGEFGRKQQIADRFCEDKYGEGSVSAVTDYAEIIYPYRPLTFQCYVTELVNETVDGKQVINAVSTYKEGVTVN